MNKTIQILQSGFSFAKDMSISDWIRAPLLIFAAVLKFLIKNLLSMMIIFVAIVVMFYLFKFFRWWKKQREDETENKKSKKHK